MTISARTRKRKKTKTGSSLVLALGILLIAAVGLMPAAQKNREKGAEAYAMIAGSVFRDPGFAVPGAEVVLAPADEPSSSKIKKQKEITNSRGEVVFRVPPGPMNYTITASAKGFNSLTKPVTVHAEERVDVTFLLAAPSNK